jgi:hypothetical protein
VIICGCCPVLLPANGQVRASTALEIWVSRSPMLEGALSCMETESRTVEGERVVALSTDAAQVVAAIVRRYRQAHGLGQTREADLGDFEDEHDPDGVRGVHPHEHRRSAVA